MSNIVEEVNVPKGLAPEFKVYDPELLQVALEEAGFFYEDIVTPSGRKTNDASIYVKGESHPVASYYEVGDQKRLQLGPGFSVYHGIMIDTIKDL
jgi:hypothetical protein